MDALFAKQQKTLPIGEIQPKPKPRSKLAAGRTNSGSELARSPAASVRFGGFGSSGR